MAPEKVADRKKLDGNSQTEWIEWDSDGLLDGHGNLHLALERPEWRTAAAVLVGK